MPSHAKLFEEEKSSVGRCLRSLDLALSAKTFLTRKQLVDFLLERAQLINEHTTNFSDAILLSEEWKPDPEVMKRLEEAISRTATNKAGFGANNAIAFGGQVLNWHELIDEVRNGSPIGRKYYLAFYEGMTGG